MAVLDRAAVTSLTAASAVLFSWVADIVGRCDRVKLSGWAAVVLVRKLEWTGGYCSVDDGRLQKVDSLKIELCFKRRGGSQGS